MTHLSITAVDRGTSSVLELTGELDMATAGQVREVLRDLRLHRGQQLVIDLAGLGFCDSSGMTALISARTHALAADGSIALTCVPNHLLRALKLMGLDQVFPLHATTSEAIAVWDARGD
jgi:anti-sigma B factor antagonist